MFLLFLSAALFAMPQARPALRVCADPANLPFSDKAAAGFDNRIAELIGADLHRRVEFVWMPESPRIVKKTLDSAKCDLLMGAPAGLERALTTEAYYRSTYVFVSRADRGAGPKSFDDPKLKDLRIGLQMIGEDFTPPAAALGRRGYGAHLRGYPVSGDAIVRAVESGEIDVAAVWGPAAGYFAKRMRGPLKVTPIPSGAGPVPMQFAISMAVRKGDTELLREVNAAIEHQRQAIREILVRYGVPLV